MIILQTQKTKHTSSTRMVLMIKEQLFNKCNEELLNKEQQKVVYNTSFHQNNPCKSPENEVQQDRVQKLKRTKLKLELQQSHQIKESIDHKTPSMKKGKPRQLVPISLTLLHCLYSTSHCSLPTNIDVIQGLPDALLYMTFLRVKTKKSHGVNLNMTYK